MAYAAVRTRRFPPEGHTLVSYMKRIKRKGPNVAMEYDDQFRLQGLSEVVALDDF